MDIMGKVKKVVEYLSQNLGGLLGIVQAFLKAVSECCIVIIRIVCPILHLPGMPKDADDKAIAKVKEISDKLLAFVEKCKNWLLGIGFKV